MCPYQIIICIILILGLFGGAINYFLLSQADIGSTNSADDTNPEKKGTEKNLLAKSLFMGVAAAILVPLFLNTISSGVLKDIISARKIDESHFIFAGFCLIAAISSKRFIEDLYDKVIKIEKKVKEVNVKVDANATETKELINANTEPPENIADAPVAAATPTPEEQKAKKVIDAFSKSRYVYRTTKGLARDCGLNINETLEVLETLKNQNIVRSKINSSGNLIWRLIY